MPLRVGEYYLIRYVAALVFFAVPFVFSQGVLTIAMGLGMAVLGYSLPAIWLGSKRSGRAKKIDGQMVEMLGMVANSLKSGYGLMQSFEFTANQMDAPLGTELKRMLRAANRGMSAEGTVVARTVEAVPEAHLRERIDEFVDAVEDAAKGKAT